MDNASILKIRSQNLYPNNVHYYQEALQLKRARGSYVYDEKNTAYLDAIGGIVCIATGHNHPRVKQKLISALEQDQIQHTSTLYLSEYVAQLAEKIAQYAPGSLTKCYLTNSGSEANEVALLTARVATGKEMVISLRHSYHGGTNTSLALCGHSSWKFPHQGQQSVVHAKAPYCYRCPYGASPKACHLECANDVKEVIQTATSGEIAAFIKEPIMGVGGFIDAPPEYHQTVYKIIKDHGGLYISDEVQTGIGRTGKHFFMSESLGVEPDLITMAKSLGSGAPIGAVIAKKEHADKMQGKTHFNTFGGDPFQAMQALETISIIEDEKLIQNADTMGKKLISAFKDLQKDYPIIGDVRGQGLLIGIELVKNPQTKEPATTETIQMMENTKNEKLLIGKGGLLGNVIRIAPPMSISNSECDELILKFQKALEKLSK